MTRDEARAEYGRFLPQLQAIQSHLVAELNRAVGRPSVAISASIRSWDSLERLAPSTLRGVSDLIGVRVIVPESGSIDSVSADVQAGLRTLAETVEPVADVNSGSKILISRHAARVQSIGVEIHVLTAAREAHRTVDHNTRFRELSGVRSVGRRTRVLHDVLDEFERLLDRPEVHEKKDVHSFLCRHDFILFQNPDALTSEVPIGLGTEHRMDFLIRRPDGTYILVEIENPQAPALTKGGDFTALLNHALRQVEDWQDWIEANIQTVERYFAGIRSPEAWVVLGRDRDLGTEGRRRIARRNINMRGRVCIKTYDDLIRDARAHVRSLERLLEHDLPE